MGSTQVSTEQQSADRVSTAAGVDLKLEVVIIPVADVDRAKRFYGSLGWRLDADYAFDNGFRVVQFTPPGSGCSSQFGTNITSAAPGSAQDLYLVVSGIEAARNELAAGGVEISEVFQPRIARALINTNLVSRQCGDGLAVRLVPFASCPDRHKPKDNYPEKDCISVDGKTSTRR